MKKAKQPAPKKKKAPAPAPKPSASVVGEVVTIQLESVQPNDWNPNVFTPFMRESLKHGIDTDGWLASQALLVWRTDKKGKPKNIIIDGEHRWLVARELGFKTGPAVFLDGLTEAQAKALTVKMDAKRGTFDRGRLETLLADISVGFEIGDLSLDLGFTTTQLGSFLAGPDADIDPDFPSGKTEHVKMVQLFFDEPGYTTFLENVAFFSKLHGKKNVTDTVLEVLRHG